MTDIYGTKWYKIDFHMHTNASTDYRDSDNYGHDNWLLKCMEKELDCVVISDHNTGKNIDEIKKAYEQIQQNNHQNFRELVIFPAVELTVNGGIHLLVIFPEDTSSQKISAFLGAVGITSNEGDIELVTNKSLPDILDLANNDYKTLNIPAHVDKDKGLFVEVQGQTLKNICLRENIFAIEQIDKSYSQPQVYKDLNLKHHRVVGSDSHDLDSIGRRFTWVKMGLPNFDGLKVALSDKLNKNIICSDENDVNYNPNNIDWEYISNLKIHKGYKIGNRRALEIQFSPWLNTIIGGRGSGKSTIIKMLQYAYGLHEKLKNGHPDKKDFYKIGSRTAPGMLRNDIEINFTYNTTEEQTYFKKTIDKYERLENGNYIEIEQTSIQEFYPVTVITQKELFDKALNPQEIFSFIDSKIGYYNWEMEFNQLVATFEESKSIERNLLQDIADKKKLEEQLKHVILKLKTYDKYHYAELLKNNSKFQDEGSKLRKIYDEMNELKALLQNISLSISFDKIDFLNDDTPNISNVKLQIDEVKKNINTQIDILEKSAKEWMEIWKNSQWNIKQTQVKSELDNLTNELKEQGTDISEYQTALDTKENISKKLDQIKQKEVALENQSNKSKQLLSNIQEKRKELYNKRSEYIDNINQQLSTIFPETRIVFSIKYLGNVIDSESEFRKVIQRQDNTFESYILQLDHITEENSGLLWDLYISDNVEDDLKNLKNNILQANSENTFNFGTRLANHFNSIYQNKINEDTLLTWFPKDKLTIEIISNGRSLDVNSASAGQRAAALMTYILLETKGPLVIDQPEDDLDSRMITKLIVDGLRKLKEKRQVIVVTHNPNIPVNAASEKIFEMDFINGQIHIKEEGTIQESNIRDSICQVMEGGEDALEHRFNKIIKFK